MESEVPAPLRGPVRRWARRAGLSSRMGMGPLEGIRLVELAGIGPTQLTGMLLGDMGADIVRIERLGSADLGIAMPSRCNLMNRSRRSLAVDLKRPEGIDIVLRLCARGDGLFEGFRPGVMERLGLGPEACLARNPKLVYGRMTGWGQDGPLAQRAGHDPNYIALAGVLAAIGERDGPPTYPLNLIGDFGGGALYLAMGMLAALLEASRSGQGQVVDCAIVDGAASLATFLYGLLAAGAWSEHRGHNILDGGAPFVHPYRTKDGQYVMLGAIEKRFYATLLERLGVDEHDALSEQMNQARWPEFQARLRSIFSTKTRDEWCALLQDTDACFAPVLSLSEAPRHPHSVARRAYVEVDGITQPGPAPRFGRTPSAIQAPPAEPGRHTRDVLQDLDFSSAEIERLCADGIVRQHGDD